jgi:hypothetical protein
MQPKEKLSKGEWISKIFTYTMGGFFFVVGLFVLFVAKSWAGLGFLLVGGFFIWLGKLIKPDSSKSRVPRGISILSNPINQRRILGMSAIGAAFFIGLPHVIQAEDLRVRLWMIAFTIFIFMIGVGLIIWSYRGYPPIERGLSKNQ